MLMNIWKYVIIIFAFQYTHCLSAEETSPDTNVAERDDFVTASLVIGSPLPAIWSVFGHATLHMECPSEGLDYMFTFESDTNVDAFLTGVAGKAQAKYVAVPAQVYIDDARKEGRELRQYRLNLTLNERKELWRRLDEEMMAGAYRHFNLLYTSCVSTTVQTVESILQGEHLEWGPTPYLMTLCDGDYFRHAARLNPWTEFTFVTFFGTAYDHHGPFMRKVTPENLATLLSEARLVNDTTGESRPVLADAGTVLLPLGKSDYTAPPSPMLVFGALLVLTLLVTTIERLTGWKWLGTAYDLLLFMAQGLAALLLLYMTFGSELFPTRWNWYLLPMLPVPFVLWALQRRGRHIARWWIAYSIVLIVFLTATPFCGILDLPHQLITASLLVRSLNRYYSIKHL